MKLLNDDFKNIVEIFENAIVMELEVIKTESDRNSDKEMLRNIDDILNTDSLMSDIIDLIDCECFFRDFLDCYDYNTHTSKPFKKYSRVAVFCAVFICNLVDEFNAFREALNKNENEQITIKDAIYYVDCMNIVTELIKQDESIKYGISLLSAAECYQALINSDVMPNDLTELRNACKARWSSHLNIEPIAKGKHGASLFKLKDMANFVRMTEGNISVLELLHHFNKYKEKPLAPL